jgi:hypothetical protein
MPHAARGASAARWGKFNAAIMKSEVNPDTGYPYLLPVMWEFAG